MATLTHSLLRYSLINVVRRFGEDTAFGLAREAHHVHEVVGRSRTAPVHLGGASLDNWHATKE